MRKSTRRKMDSMQRYLPPFYATRLSPMLFLFEPAFTIVLYTVGYEIASFLVFCIHVYLILLPLAHSLLPMRLSNSASLLRRPMSSSAKSFHSPTQRGARLQSADQQNVAKEDVRKA